MMKSPHKIVLQFIILLTMVSGFGAAYASEDKTGPQSWEGVWFSCEFAQRQRAPDEGCQMFDDEGFRYEDGKLTYLRAIGSVERDCRGNKVGQCFLREAKSISVSEQKIGELRIEDDRLILRYWGCEQSYRLYHGADYMTVKPLGKSCLWSQERHFYIAPYQGRITIAK